MSEPVPDPILDQPIVIHGNITNNTVTFAICQNSITGAVFLTMFDSEQHMGSTLFAKPEELRKFARGIIQVCQSIN